MIRAPTILVALLMLAVLSPTADARVWTDSTDKYTVDADLVAFNEKNVILAKPDHQLVAVPLDKLSPADAQYLQSEDAKKTVSDVTGAMQTWTMRDGTKVIGRVVDFARKPLTLQRRRGNIYVNDRLYDHLPEIYQLMIPKIVAHFDKLNQPDRQGLEAWMVRQKGQPRTFTLEGVILELEGGDEYGVPFFFFSDQDLAILKPGWDEWLATHQSYDESQEKAFRLQSLAAAYQKDKQIERQIAMTQLNLQAVQAGLTSVWEVTLYPAAGNAGPPQSVVMYGRNSAQATAAALEQYPGYVAGPVRKVGGF